MSSEVFSNPNTNRIPNTALEEGPEQDSQPTEANHPWPGKSEPGHIRPIGPAYRSGTRPSPEVPDTQR
jgi:hypothetical protein